VDKPRDRRANDRRGRGHRYDGVRLRKRPGRLSQKKAGRGPANKYCCFFNLIVLSHQHESDITIRANDTCRPDHLLAHRR